MNQEKIQELVSRSQQDDKRAFALLVSEFQPLVFRLAFRLLCDEEEARDITQETFVNFFAKLSDYHYQGKTMNYLYTIAGNLCKNHCKKKKDVLMDDEFLLTHGMSNDMEQVLDKMFIDSAISSLSKELKEVVVLYYLDGFKIAEIAEKLQISLSLAKYRLTNARKQLEIFGREEDIHEKEL
mgnify:CR=1 FL=1